MSGIIALLTDFGLEDIYVGVMKGVILSINPDARIIDITHAIPPQSILVGALALRNSYAWFPPQTVFVVVVDPGVGSSRHPIAVRAGDTCFVAPDNGILDYTLQQFEQWQAVELSSPVYRNTHISTTFHGRDIFAPAAAYLAADHTIFSELGQPCTELVRLPPSRLQVTQNALIGEIIHIDHFGNLITNIGPFRWIGENTFTYSTPSQPLHITANQSSVQLKDFLLQSVHKAYYKVNPGDLLAQLDSNGYLEIAVNQGNAALRTGAVRGDRVTLVTQPT